MRTLTVCLWALCAAALVAACTDTLPCNTCPNLEGTWRFAYQPTTLTADCGTLTQPTPPATMTFTRSGSRVTGTVAGADVSGTIFDTWQYVIQGDTSQALGGTLSIDLRGRFSPSAPDAGTDGTLRGTYATRASDGTQECSAESDYTAAR